MNIGRHFPTLNSLLAQTLTLAWLATASSGDRASAAVPVDLSKYDPKAMVQASVSGDTLTLRWILEDYNGDSVAALGRNPKIARHGELELCLAPGEPLIKSIGVAATRTGPARPILRDVDPVTIVTVGERNLKRRSGWTIFFDKVHKRPHTTHLAKLDLKSARVASDRNASLTVSLAGLTAGSFDGELLFTVYPFCSLVHVEAVLSTEQGGRAIVYDAGIVSSKPAWQKTVWLNPEGALQSANGDSRQSARPLAVRHRVIAAENENGSIAIFPAPHRYFYPLDFANNFKFAWQGSDYRGASKGHGLGFRQPLNGDNRYVPWFNAPPGTAQRLSAFYLISDGDGETAISEVKRFTRDDKFKPLKGHRTFTSHFHVEHTLEYLKRQKAQGTTGIPAGLKEPGFVKTFKDMGLDIVHLAEFHNGRTPKLKAPERLAQLKLMHEECDRLSTRKFLLLPGEEPNVHLGGHWISFFPKPVYCVLNRSKEAPFVTQEAGIGTVYHVGNAADALELFKRENGLNRTAHARIKGSTGFPDAYAKKDYYLSDTFLGAAWKSMPADLSNPRLGTRVLDLQDDMLNWGQKKYILGEVDVFKIEPDYELYAHMNVNYLRLKKIPRFKQGWQPVLDCLREGRFFVTTGEILIERFSVNGKESGETAKFMAGERLDIRARVQTTFPLAFYQIVTGDGKRVKRQQFRLTREGSFLEKEIKSNYPTTKDGFHPRWIRFEIWDVAGNGAFTPPVWLEDESSRLPF